MRLVTRALRVLLVIAAAYYRLLATAMDGAVGRSDLAGTLRVLRRRIAGITPA